MCGASPERAVGRCGLSSSSAIDAIPSVEAAGPLSQMRQGETREETRELANEGEMRRKEASDFTSF